MISSVSWPPSPLLFSSICLLHKKTCLFLTTSSSSSFSSLSFPVSILFCFSHFCPCSLLCSFFIPSFFFFFRLWRNLLLVSYFYLLIFALCSVLSCYLSFYVLHYIFLHNYLLHFLPSIAIESLSASTYISFSSSFRNPPFFHPSQSFLSCHIFHTKNIWSISPSSQDSTLVHLLYLLYPLYFHIFCFI